MAKSWHKQAGTKDRQLKGLDVKETNMYRVFISFLWRVHFDKSTTLCRCKYAYCHDVPVQKGWIFGSLPLVTVYILFMI